MSILVLKFIYKNNDNYYQIIDLSNDDLKQYKSIVYPLKYENNLKISLLSMDDYNIEFKLSDKNYSLSKGNSLFINYNDLLTIEWLDNEYFEEGLCFEIGIDKQNYDLALESYYLCKNNEDCLDGIKRILITDYRYGSKIGKFNTKIDDVQMAIFYKDLKKYYQVYDYLKYRRPKRFNHIDIDIKDYDVNDVKDIMIIETIRYFDRFRYNDNKYFDNIFPMLATFYDDINNVLPEDRKVYYEVNTERDYYDGGTIDKVSIFMDSIADTLIKESVKNDVLAIGSLINEFAKYIDNEAELVSKLENISKDGNTKEKALASSFLGLYYYNKKDTINGDKYYKLALNNGFDYKKI